MNLKMFQYMTQNVFNSSIINIYCYCICLLWSNLAVFWNLWVFFSKHFLITQEKFTSKFISLSQFYKCGNWATISKQAKLSLISQNIKITWSSWDLVIAFFEHLTCFHVFLQYFLLQSDWLWFFINGWHPYSKCLEKRQFDDTGGLLGFFLLTFSCNNLPISAI